MTAWVLGPNLLDGLRREHQALLALVQVGDVPRGEQQPRRRPFRADGLDGRLVLPDAPAAVYQAQRDVARLAHRRGAGEREVRALRVVGMHAAESVEARLQVGLVEE